MITRSYTELIQLDSFIDRFNYLALRARVGQQTFGIDRWVNQEFYQSYEWRQARSEAIVRDQACDLAVAGYDIHESAVVHHIIPMTLDHIEHGDPLILSLENLITTTHKTHNAIHYGDARLLNTVVERKPGDTKLW